MKEGDTGLLPAAAGGAGLLMVQIAKRLGANVIGSVSNSVKKSLSQQAGADHVIRKCYLLQTLDFVRNLSPSPVNLSLKTKISATQPEKGQAQVS